MPEKPVEPPPYRSAMEDYPEHVKAIGMLSIELSNLEIFLGEMLGGLLKIPRHVGHILYLTPRASIARLDMLGNVAKAVLVEKSDGLKKIEKLIERCQTTMGKRHKMIHGAWVISPTSTVAADGDPVNLMELPLYLTFNQSPMPLKRLTKRIYDVRELIRDVRQETDILYRDGASTTPSHGKSVKRLSVDKIGTNRHRPDKSPKPKRRRKPSLP
jgi:hypothetical protein